MDVRNEDGAERALIACRHGEVSWFGFGGRGIPISNHPPVRVDTHLLSHSDDASKSSGRYKRVLSRNCRWPVKWSPTVIRQKDREALFAHSQSGFPSDQFGPATGRDVRDTVAPPDSAPHSPQPRRRTGACPRALVGNCRRDRGHRRLVRDAVPPTGGHRPGARSSWPCGRIRRSRSHSPQSSSPAPMRRSLSTTGSPRGRSARPTYRSRIAAMASFASYSIGHNIGATAFSGGAIRYRIYSSRGLTVVDVAKICFVTGLTFWLGNITVLGLGMIVAPEAATSVDQLSPGINRLIGIAALCGLIGYVTWVSVWPAPDRTRSLEPRSSRPGLDAAADRHRLPRPDLMFARHVHADADSEPHHGFITVAVVFVSATRCSASPAIRPDRLGVFDAAMVFAFAAAWTKRNWSPRCCFSGSCISSRRSYWRFPSWRYAKA